MREQLAARLRREPDLEVVAMASSSRQVWQEAQARGPDVLLIDPLMRDGLGLATLRQVHTNFPNLVILVLTAYVDTTLNMHLQQMGIRHVLTKVLRSSHLLAEARAAYASVHFPDSPEP